MTLNDNYFLNPAHFDLAKARYFLKDKDGSPVEKDIEEVFVRVVNHIYKNDKDNKEEALKFRKEKKIIDAGRPLAQAGTNVNNLLNCFVIGFDDDTREAISELKRKHFAIQALGGGTGINFSSLRPNGSVCRTTQSRSSGAVGFITDFSYQSANITGGGNRSGANMGILEDWHPDLYEFITTKSLSNWENIRKFATIFNEDEFSYFQWNQTYPWQMFNVSVFISDDFMDRVIKNSKKPWTLSWNKTPWFLWTFKNPRGPKTFGNYEKVITVTAPNEDMARYKASSQIPFFNDDMLELVKGPYELTATEWFRMICQNAREDGCPGIIFVDMARRFHNGEYFNPIEGTNPCFSGDTMVAVADGRGAISIKQLAEEEKDVPVYSVNSKGMVEVKHGRHPRKTRTNVKLVRVTLDDGTFLDVTPDHNFLLRNGTKKEAKDLVCGDSLPRFNKLPERIKKDSDKKYLRVYCNTLDSNKNKVFEHRLISKFYNEEEWISKYDSEKNSGWINGGIVVHHKDYNPINNSPENLSIMSFSEHSKLHGSVDNNGENNPMYGKRHSEETKRKIGNKTLERCANPEYKSFFSARLRGAVTDDRRDKARQLQHDRNIKRWDKIEKKTDLNTTWKNNRLCIIKECRFCKSEMILHWEKRSVVFCSSGCHLGWSKEFSEGLFAKAREALKNRQKKTFEKQINIYNDLKIFLEREPFKKEWENKCKELDVSYRLRPKLDSENILKSFKHLKEVASSINHKVISVKALDKKQDVYNITVDDNYTVGIVTDYSADTGKCSGIFTFQCAEQIFGKNSVCCLTSLVLPSFFVDGEFNWDEFEKAIWQAVRGLDNIISLNKTGEKDIDETSLNERRIGLGTTGLAELLILMNLKYSSQAGRNFADKMLDFLKVKAYEASIELAKERGPFPAYEFKGYSKSEFFQGLPENIKNLIRRHGIRNVTILTQAPSGTTGTMVGYSQGCEPYFAMCLTRNSRIGSFQDGSPAFIGWLKDNDIDYSEYDFSLSKLRETAEVPGYFEEAHEVHWEDHLKMQAIFAKHVDSSVSKCIAKGTLINTNKGIIPIENLSDFDYNKSDTFSDPNNNYKVLDENGNPKRITKHYYGGKKISYKVRFNNGFELTAAYTHKLKTESGFKRIIDLCVGDKVFYRTNKIEDDVNEYISLPQPNSYNNIKRKFPKQMDEEFAKFLGMWMADGHCNINSIVISEKNEEVKRETQLLMKSIFNIVPSISIDQRSGVRNHVLNSRYLSKYFSKNYGNNALNKRIPKELLLSKNSVKKAFLEGISLDGYKKRGELVIYDGYSKDIADKVSFILSSLGIRYYLGKKHVPEGRLSKYSYSVCAKLNDENYIVPVESYKKLNKPSVNNNQVYLKPEIRDSLLGLFGVGVKESWKRRNLRNSFKNDGFVKINAIKSIQGIENFDIDYELSCVKITNIDLVGEVDVYDIEVENTHSYLINGIVSHNTINLPNSATVDDIESAYIQAYKMGIKSTTVYRDGSKQQILEHISASTQNEDVRPKNLIAAHAPKRPKNLNCDIHHTSIKGERWTVIVGLLDDRPYEIFCAPQSSFEIPQKCKNGILVKNGKGSYHLDTDDFILKNISSLLQTDEHRMITRLLSTCLRHGVSIGFIAEQVTKVDGTVVDFSKAILRVLKKYQDLGTSVTGGLICERCGGNDVILVSGCPQCMNQECQYSKCE